MNELEHLMRENTRLRQELAELKDLVYRDALTGLRNRRYFEERMQEELAHARRHQAQGAVLLLDLDEFKRINDELGHLAGDAALCDTAALLERSVRADDVVCRLGGDEFVVLLHKAGLEGAQKVAARLRARLDEELGLPGFSIGIALWDEHDQELSPVLHRADVAMYADKAARRASREQLSVAA